MFVPTIFILTWGTRERKRDGETPGEGEKAQAVGQALWWMPNYSFPGFWYHRHNSFRGQTPSLACLGPAAGREWGQGPGLVPQAQLWSVLRVGGGRRWCLRLCLNFPWISEPTQVPEHLPARWHLLLFLLQPGSEGCSEAVCRQVSLPSVLGDFTALQFCSGVSWELQGSCISFLLARASLSIDMRPLLSAETFLFFLSTTCASFCLAYSVTSAIPQGITAPSHLSISPVLLVQATRTFLVYLLCKVYLEMDLLLLLLLFTKTYWRK